VDARLHPYTLVVKVRQERITWPCCSRSRLGRTATASTEGMLDRHQASTSAKRRSASEPKSRSRVSFARVVAGLVMPARKRACCLAVPSASGWPPLDAASASTSSAASQKV